MKKIAFFLEGQTEVLFVERLLTEVAGSKGITLQKADNRGKDRLVRLAGQAGSTGTPYFALLVDCGGDGAVASDLKDNYQSLIQSGYSRIVGIRDVHPKTRAEIPKLQKYLYYNMKTKPVRPDLILAVMEIETWFIAEDSHFVQISPRLTADTILAGVGYDPSLQDPEEIDHPADDLHRIYQLAGCAYRKRQKTVRRTVEALDVGRLYLEVPKRVPRLAELVSLVDCFLTD